MLFLFIPSNIITICCTLFVQQLRCVCAFVLFLCNALLFHSEILLCLSFCALFFIYDSFSFECFKYHAFSNGTSVLYLLLICIHRESVFVVFYSFFFSYSPLLCVTPQFHGNIRQIIRE